MLAFAHSMGISPCWNSGKLKLLSGMRAALQAVTDTVKRLRIPTIATAYTSIRLEQAVTIGQNSQWWGAYRKSTPGTDRIKSISQEPSTITTWRA